METNDIFKKVRKIEIKTRGLSNHIFSGQYHSAFKGRGMTFSEVREYEYGDDIRNIDWNVTARFNRPFVKIFEEEREMTVMLLIDVSGSRGDWAFGLLEYTISPHWSFSIADKWNYGNPVPEFRDHYFTGNVTFIHEATRVMLSAGRQSEGVVRVGGVCRVVPASSGVTLTVSTSF